MGSRDRSRVRDLSLTLRADALRCRRGSGAEDGNEPGRVLGGDGLADPGVNRGEQGVSGAAAVGLGLTVTVIGPTKELLRPRGSGSHAAG